MRKKILLLFSLVILCIPLSYGQDGGWVVNSYQCFQEQMITSVVANAGITNPAIQFSNGKAFQLSTQSGDAISISKSDMTASFVPTFSYYVSVQKYGWTAKLCPPTIAPGSYLLSSKQNAYQKKSGVSFYGTDLNGNEVEIKTFHNVVSGTTLTFTADEFKNVRKYTNVRFQITQEEDYAASEITFNDRIVDASSFRLDYTSAADGYDQDKTVCSYSYSYGVTADITNSTSQNIILSGDLNSTITGATVNGSASTNNSLNISNSGTGTITLTECNFSNIVFDLSNVDFTCQTISSIQLQDASGILKQTFSTGDIKTIGTSQIQLSLLNTVGITDNDKLLITLTNGCTLTNLETNYTIILRTEAKNQKALYVNSQLYPDGSNKVAMSIAQKSGTSWCDYSTAYFFTIPGTNGYSNIAFTNATADGTGAYSVPTGQAAILGTANFGKCLTSVSIPVPATKMPKTPVIADAEYCDGGSINYAVQNPSDFTTETFRLLIDGTEKVGWQSNTFAGITLGKIAQLPAVVQATNGQCTTSSNTATISCRIQPIALTFTGATSYYTEQVNTTITQTSSQDGVTYSIYKDGSATPQDTWTGIKAQALTKGTYVITATNANASCSAQTTVVITEKDLNIGAGWTTTDLSFCQLDGNKDLNNYVTFNGTSSVTFSCANSGLYFVGSLVVLTNSTPGTYTVTCTAVKDGITKTFDKTFTVKAKANDVALTLVNSSTWQCSTTEAAILQCTTDYPSYTYTWYGGNKGTTVLSGTTRTINLSVKKEDGNQILSVVATAPNGCSSNKSGTYSIAKQYITADVSFPTTPTTYCQSIGGTANIFDDLSGADKAAVTGEQNYYSYNISCSTSDLVIVNRNKINLERSKPGVYTVTMTISQYGCYKNITMNYVIKAMPEASTITLTNASTIECDLSNPNALVHADHSAYNYSWYRNGTKLTDVNYNPDASIPVTKADGLTTIYALPFVDGCQGVQTNAVTLKKSYMDADIAFVSGTAALCQTATASTTDIFDYLTGTDRMMIEQQQSGYTWTLSVDYPQIILATHFIDLQQSAAGTYTVTMTITNSLGCSKSITKTIKIYPAPQDFTINQSNSDGFSCNTSAAQLSASVVGYTYTWYKNGTSVVTGQSVSIPVNKTDITDNSRTIYAIGKTSNGCTTNASSALILAKKNYLEADLSVASGTATFCQSPTAGTTADIFDFLSGADKLAVTGKQHYTWAITATGLTLASDGHSIDLYNSNSGNYTILFSYANENSCSATLTLNVIILPKPSSFTINQSNIDGFSCNTSSAQLSASLSGLSSYTWYKNGTNVGTGQSITTAVALTDVTDASRSIYAIGTASNGCSTDATPSIVIPAKHYMTTDLSISSGTTTLCQSPTSGTTADIFDFLSGTDKLAVTGKQHYTWAITATGLTLASDGHSIDLYNSTPGNYAVTFTYSNDNNCSASLTKMVSIKPMPSTVSVSLVNASTTACDRSAANVFADNSAYTYNWTKNGVAVTGNTQSMSIPVSKADGLTSISAVPVLNGCIGLQSNTISLTKRYVEADFGYNNTPIAVASKDEKINLFDYTVGKDKDAIINQTSGYTYKIAFSPVKQTTISTTDGTVVPSTGLQTGDTQYTLGVTVSKLGCDTLYSKSATIKAIPRNITIDFATTQSTQECTSNNYMNVVASDSTSGFVYSWYKNDVLVIGQTSYKAAIEVFKTDGTVKIYAIPSTKDGYAGYKTNILNTTKRYITTDLQLDNSSATFCSVAGGKVNIFDYVRGNDKAAVLAGQYGYTYTTAGDCGTAIASNQYIDVDNSLADDNTTKTVSLTVSQNGCSLTQTKSFVIKRRPADIKIELLSESSNTTNKSLFCSGDTLQLHVSTSNTSGVSYNWFKEGVLLGTTTTPTYVYPFTDATGTINLSAASTYNNGCQSTVSNIISVQKKDVSFGISMDNTPIAYCPAATKINLFDYVSGTDKNDVMAQSNNCSYEFTASGNNGLAVVSYNYLDLDNSTYSSNPYTLTLNVNKQGCTKAFTKSISIKPRPVTPLITLTSDNNLRFCGGDLVSFTDQNKATGTNYKWNVNGTEIAGTGTLKYPTTATSDDLTVSATAYYNSNSCPSKASNTLDVANVIPQVEIKLMATSVTVNDAIQFYIFEPVASKSITLTAVRTSDQTVTDLPYTREGNVITLKGMLPIGTYTFSAVAENAITGYCSQNIVIANTLTVSNSGTTSTTKVSVSEVTVAEETARKAIYDEYMSQLKAGDVHSILLPILTLSSESAKLSVFTTYTDESVVISIYNIQGQMISTRNEALSQGENDFQIESNQKPSGSGMYLVKIDYNKARKSETLKGLIK